MSFLPPVFAALSDPTRFAIVETLLRDGERSAGDIGKDFDISAPAISRHLNVLTDAGVITRRVEGRKRIYAMRPVVMQAISSWTMSHREFWQSSLDRLEAALKQEMQRK